MIKISVTIVVYNEKEEFLLRVIEDILEIDLDKEVLVVDNSADDSLKKICQNYDAIQYIYSGKNLGFGAGHNLGFSKLHVESDYHLVVNADTYFKSRDIKEFVLWTNKHKDISLAVPRVYFPDGTLQNTIRDIPTPMTLIKRRLNIKDRFYGVEFKEVTEIPFAHGCFFIFETKVFKKLNGFDERFFMYMEDVDICIRAKEFGKTVINPNYKVYHEYAKGSSKSFKLLRWHIMSAIKFFMITYSK